MASPEGLGQNALGDTGTPFVLAYPNLKRVQTGVSSTVFGLARAFRRAGVPLVLCGIGFPEELGAGFWLQALWNVASTRHVPVIWHARRNSEMVLGLLIRLVNPRLRLIFTSAAQRKHTALTAWLMGLMDAIVATSEKSAAFVPFPSVVIGHGVEMGGFGPPDKTSLRRRLNLAQADHYVGCFGAVRHGKGTDLFISALETLLPARPTWRAIVVGNVTAINQDFARRLRNRIQRAGLADRVTFTGHVPDARDLIRSVDICVAPSRSEGFGLTPLEAMAAGVPTVASSAGSYPEIVADGETGFVADKGSAEALTECLRRLMDDPPLRDRMAANCRTRAVAQFPIEREADALLGLYRSLAATEPRQAGARSETPIGSRRLR